MYNAPLPGTIIGGTVGIGTGTLAVTGMNALSLGLLAAVLIVSGLLLMRIAYLARTRDDHAVPAT